MQKCSTIVAQFIFNLLLEVGDVSQQKEMLIRVLDHKLLSTVRPNHWMNQSDAMATSKIMGNVKAGLHSIHESKRNLTN